MPVDVNALNSRTCHWVLIANSSGHGLYCGERNEYKMIRDDDGNLVRKYYMFCPMHMAKAAAQENKDD